MRGLMILGLAMMLFLTSCSSGMVEANVDFEEKKVSSVDSEVMESVDASNEMGLDLVKDIAKLSDDNVLLSPTSLSIALAMLQEGAEGSTKEGIYKVMKDDSTSMKTSYNTFINYLNGLEDSDQPSIKMTIANSFWIEKAFEPKDDYVNDLTKYYDAEVYSEDFKDPATLDKMNLWVEEMTNHLLKDTLDKISEDAVAYLMNTVYFKGTWESEFYEGNTLLEDFYGKETKSVDMMHKRDAMSYFEDKECQMMTMPYYGNSEMVVILPKEDMGTYLDKLEYDEISNMLDNTSYQELNISFPKLDYKTKNPLKDLLIEKGMAESFSETQADFSSMIEVKGRNVYVSDIFQNARIIVDEEGTEAAAVTVVEMECTSAMPSDPVDFVCNKPFIYIIREGGTGAALFIGLVRLP
ncbi:serpin family protein [Acidaminobacter sp. JC074]|uniref:serpin family protein n=1 Tax=Acidaminobacter sp. JC074 TaxID=2530199 RepID=UPI001F118D0A|nr:serpin family protein [Acidaminobacter sp. JC074]MCH4887075.1 serpin family protein [Acidaminobacter sp. JC074]